MKKRVTIIITFSCIFSFCSNPNKEIENKTWEGQIHRMSDDKILSDIKLKICSDTMFLFSNAIFGSENDTLLLQNFSNSDSIFTYKSLKGERFQFKFKYEKNEDYEHVYLIGNDYYISIVESFNDLKTKSSLDFYKNIKVPRKSYMYLDGAYEGKLEMENQLTNMYLAEMGGISVKMVFIDNFKVKIYLKNAFVDLFSGSTKPSYETVSYNIVGNKLYLDNNKSNSQVIEVKNMGEMLILATDDANVIMHKVY